MGPRTRKAVASILMLVFLALYVWGAATLADRLPDNRVIEVIYFAIVGVAWGLPLLPLMKWAETGRL
ncbi:DUF2842 domain-containing protein [Brevundimonas sp. 2R-24]|uniref:DUF2842 domain-containing protein n=1 Tax=Peiella sedimenti TaxID=3061083 RepID=A0ABT8SJC8_9CAUL|nr:DUF2842 domain-containing protein [Caulobacteraceae bacterium XZ-24]